MFFGSARGHANVPKSWNGRVKPVDTFLLPFRNRVCYWNIEFGIADDIFTSMNLRLESHK